MNQEAHDLHILRFRSTHQYYRTVEYEPNRTIDHEDRAHDVLTVLTYNSNAPLVTVSNYTADSNQPCAKI